jgi:glycosyltransferase involved in cell wall biosynthesis
LTDNGRTGFPRVAFVYPNPRRELAREVALGHAPDTTLLGQNHLPQLGVDAVVHDPPAAAPQFRRFAWHARELVVPWQLGSRVDLVFTPLLNLLPLAARLRGRPGVVGVNFGHCTIWQRSSPARRRLLRRSLRSAETIVCLGPWQRELLIAQTGIPADRVAVARLGVDAGYFTPRAAQARSEPLVVAVGKDPARDYASFVDAVSGLGVKAEIACLPRNLDGVRLPPSVRARFVSAAELRTLYADAACVVLPQRRADYPYGSEGGGLTALLEAMAMARPIVVTDRPMLRDYVEHENQVVFAPAEDPVALAAAIERVLSDAQLARSLGASARERVDAGLTTRHFAEQLVPIFERAAGDGARRSS